MTQTTYMNTLWQGHTLYFWGYAGCFAVIGVCGAALLLGKGAAAFGRSLQGAMDLANQPGGIEKARRLP